MIVLALFNFQTYEGFKHVRGADLWVCLLVCVGVLACVCIFCVFQKEKQDRHREQSRLNGQFKRDQLNVRKTRLKMEVSQMLTYTGAIDVAPFVTMVLSATNNNFRVLYVNKTVTEKRAMK